MLVPPPAHAATRRPRVLTLLRLTATALAVRLPALTDDPVVLTPVAQAAAAAQDGGAAAGTAGSIARPHAGAAVAARRLVRGSPWLWVNGDGWESLYPARMHFVFHRDDDGALRCTLSSDAGADASKPRTIELYADGGRLVGSGATDDLIIAGGLHWLAAGSDLTYSFRPTARGLLQIGIRGTLESGRPWHWDLVAHTLRESASVLVGRSPWHWSNDDAQWWNRSVPLSGLHFSFASRGQDRLGCDILAFETPSSQPIQVNMVRSDDSEDFVFDGFDGDSTQLSRAKSVWPLGKISFKFSLSWTSYEDPALHVDIRSELLNGSSVQWSLVALGDDFVDGLV